MRAYNLTLLRYRPIVDWPTPQSPKDLRAFLGLTEFYRKFVKGYTAIVAPLTRLLCKDAFQWMQESQAAFETLKTAITKAPVLALPDFTLPFALEKDASGTTMGVVLHQRSHPIAFFSKPFCPCMQHASAYVRELHVIIAAIRKWRQYLLGHKFTIFTDHRNLRDLMSQVIQTLELQFYLAKLLGFDYDIQYKARTSNVVSYSLSRIDNSSSTQCLCLSITHHEFLTQLKESLLSNSEFQKQREAFQSRPEEHPNFKLTNDLLFFLRSHLD